MKLNKQVLVYSLLVSLSLLFLRCGTTADKSTTDCPFKLPHGKLEIWELYDQKEMEGAIQQINATIAHDAQDSLNDGIQRSPERIERLARMKEGFLMKDRGESGGIGAYSATDTAMIRKYLNSASARRLLPTDARLYWSIKPIKDFKTNQYTDRYELYAVKHSSTQPELTGNKITNVYIIPGRNDHKYNSYKITFSLDEKGALAWKKVTQQNIGKHVGILIGNKVITSSRIHDTIADGKTEIIGAYTKNEAECIAGVLKSSIKS